VNTINSTIQMTIWNVMLALLGIVYVMIF